MLEQLQQEEERILSDYACAWIELWMLKTYYLKHKRLPEIQVDKEDPTGTGISFAVPLEMLSTINQLMAQLSTPEEAWLDKLEGYAYEPVPL